MPKRSTGRTRRALLIALSVSALLSAGASPSRAEIIRQDIGPLELKGLHTPNEGPREVLPVRFPRAGWLRGFSVHLVDARGAPADSRAVFCHAAIRVPPPEDRAFTGGTLYEPLHITLSEGDNEMTFPDGYGLLVDSTTPAEIEVKLQNQDLANEGAYTFRIAYDFSARGEAPPLKTLESFVVPVGPPAAEKGEPPPLLWSLPKGKSRYEAEFAAPYSGTLHYLSYHIHQYARELALIDKKSGKALVSQRVRNRPDGWPAETPAYSDAAGIPVAQGQRLVFRLDSDNTGAEPVDVMSLMRVFVHRDARSAPGGGPP